MMFPCSFKNTLAGVVLVVIFKVNCGNTSPSDISGDSYDFVIGMWKPLYLN